MERISEIKKFLCSNALFVIGGIIAAIGLAVGIALLADGSGGGAVLLFVFAIGLCLIGLELKSRINLNNWLKNAEETNKLKSVINDFDNGEVFFDKHLRMGEEYVFMDRMGKIYEYSDIKGVDLKSNVIRGMVNSQLRFKTTKGKKPFVSGSSSLETVEQEYAVIIALVQKHNHNVKIGKHKKIYN